MGDEQAQPVTVSEVSFKPKDKRIRVDSCTKWREDYIEAAYTNCREKGWGQARLAKHFHVNPDTIVQWMKDHPAFGDAVRLGKQHFDQTIVEHRLLRRALGFKTMRVTRRYKVKEDKTEELLWEQTDEIEVPPDTNALKMWLSCRDPERWPNRQDVNVTGGPGFAIKILAPTIQLPPQQQMVPSVVLPQLPDTSDAEADADREGNNA